MKRYINPFFWLITYLFLAGAGLIWLNSQFDKPLLDYFFGVPIIKPALIGMGIGLVISLLCKIAGNSIDSIRKMEQEFSFMIGYQGVIDCFILSIISAVGEETFFRGALNSKFGIIWSSVVFGLLHWPLNPNLLLWPFFAFAMGITFCLEITYTNTLITPICTHFVVNFINLNRISFHYKTNFEKYEGA
ncbi:MAG: CPBP family intramembrane metalloprotease [Planctomycetes bacterium]|nr:CPBP family intramembrane metalloprotease [Planctomycetota bacterium]